MAGLLGQFLTGVAEVAVPAAERNHQAKILAQRDAQLRKYQQEATADAQTYQTGERVAAQNYTTQNRAEDMTYQTGRDTVTDAQSLAQAGLDERRVAAQERETNDQILNSGLARDAAGYVNTYSKDVEDARRALMNAKPEERPAAYQFLLQVQSKQDESNDGISNSRGSGAGGDAFKWIQMTKKDAEGNEYSELVRTNPATGVAEVERLGKGQVMPPQGAVDEYFATDRSDAEKAELDKWYGDGMAAILDRIYATDRPNVPEPAATVGPQTTPPASAGDQSGRASRSVLADNLGGWNLPGQSAVDMARQDQPRKNAANAERENRLIVEDVRELMKSRDLRWIARPGGVKKAQRALDSGMLSPEEAGVLRSAIETRQ